MPPDSEIQNLLDSIGDRIDSTLYKLRFLSWFMVLLAHQGFKPPTGGFFSSKV
jgi:hypothetical protein